MTTASRDLALLNNDLYFLDGDIAIMESDVQHVLDTINACPGWWKQNPTDGVAIIQYLNTVSQGQEISRNVEIQLKSDGYNSIPDFLFDAAGNFNINPVATQQ